MSKNVATANASDRKLRSRDNSEKDDTSVTSEVTFPLLAQKRTETLQNDSEGESEYEDGNDQTLFDNDNLGNEERNGEGIGGIETDNTEDDDDNNSIDHSHVDNINVVVTNQNVPKTSKKKPNLSPAAVTFTPAPQPASIPIPAGGDPMLQYMAMMMNQMQEANRVAQFNMQEQNRIVQEQNRLANERMQEQAREDRRQFQKEIAALRIQPAPTASRSIHLRTGKPPQFDLEGDRNKFAMWKTKWGYYIQSSGIADLSGSNQKQTMRAELNLAMSDATIQWLNSEDITTEQREDPEFVINRIEQYVKNSSNALVAVLDTLHIKHPVGSSVAAWGQKVWEMSLMCDAEKITNPREWVCLLSLGINMSIPQAMTKVLLMKNPELTFHKALEICIEEEKAIKTARKLNPGSVDPYAAATSQYKADRKDQDQQSRQGGGNGHQRRGRSQSRGGSQQRSGSGSRPASGGPVCGWCGYTKHPSGKICPAKDRECGKCKKMGHYAKMCKSSGGRANRAEASNDNEETNGSLGHVHVCSSNENIEPLDLIEVTFNCENGRPVSIMALPDTGANITAMSPHTLKQSGNTYLPGTTMAPKSADGSRLKTLGSAMFQVCHKDKITTTEVFIIEGLEKPILSRKVLKLFKLIPADFPFAEVNAVNNEPVPEPVQVFQGRGPELDALMNMPKYAPLFDGKCKVMKNGLYHIDMEPDATPINTGASRNVPDPLLPALRKEIDSLLAQGIIEEVSGATPWLHPIVIVSKKNTSDIRMCVDLTKLNKFVRRPTNPQLTPWEVVRNIPKGTKHYAVFDALKGYHQIELDEESRALTSFMTPFGRMRYCRLPMGLSSAGDVFTLSYGNAVDEAVDGRRATEDTLLRGATTQELVDNTEQFFNQCLENNITLNVKKIQWDKEEVLFGGFLLTPSGYRIDPALNKALAEFPIPKNQTDVRSFMGLANQTCNFSDEISSLLMPLKGLLKKGVKFEWLPEFQTAFEKARTHLSSEKALAFYDATKPTRLIADASRLFGLGFVLKQEVEAGIWKTVQAGSRFLSPAETRYAMIELELLAICWATNKCRMFVEGLPRSQFEVWTDHAPLVPILEKYSLPEIENKRLQRLKMKVDHLTFRTKWIKGTDNVEADSLSRNPCAQAKPVDELDELNNIYVAHLSICCFENIAQINQTTTPIRDQRLQEVMEASQTDPEYVALKATIMTGFPNEKSGMEEKLRAFWQHRSELYIDSDDFIMYKNRLLVPRKLRETYLLRLLAMHQAADKMMARARMSIWWPSITRDVSNTALSCQPCQEVKPSNRAEPLRHHEEATYPFQYVHMDLGEVNGKHFLVSVDQYSGFPHIFECGNITKTEQIIKHTVSLFENFSVPIVIYSDGGPQFKSEFADFCQKWGIQHITSSPYMSRSNGVAEEAVKEAKKLIRANISPAGVIDKQSMVAGLMMFRNTPRKPTDMSPAQLVFGRDIRDSLPMTRASLKPAHRFAVELRSQNVRKLQMKERGKELELLQPGQKVFVQHPTTRRWTRTATVIKFGANDREYFVKDDDNGATYRRNRKFLRPQTVKPIVPPRQPVRVPELQPQPEERQRFREQSSESRAVPAINDRPKRSVKPIVRFVPNLNQYDN